jgi:uncharacterized membrane protein YGL010W
MRTLQQWVGEYSESHRNPRNKLIHWICVPLIVWTVTALLWVVPMPEALGGFSGSWALLAAVLAIGFYASLSVKLALVMTLVFAVNLGLSWAIAQQFGNTVLLWTAVAVFVLAWIAQFIGHEIEGKKPSFLTDLAFLLIGPAWIANYVCLKLGVRL